MMVLALLLSGADAFTTKKRERRQYFNSASIVKEENQNKEQSAHANTSSSTSIFVQAPATMATTIPHIIHEDDEEDLNISYGVAFASCVLSVALGFGFGYGT